MPGPSPPGEQAAAAPRRELRNNCVSLVENCAQTLGVLSPVGRISLIIPLLTASAGNGTWLLLLITCSIFLIVMLTVLRFASLHSSAGSLAAFLTTAALGIAFSLLRLKEQRTRPLAAASAAAAE